MNTYVFDCEANGLNPDKIHCASWFNTETKEMFSTSDYEEMRKFFAFEDKTLVAHNCTLYDIPVVEKILGIKVKAELIDTLALSWYTKPDRLKHNLESYGEDFGVPKLQIQDWEGLTTEEYIQRCERDVEINQILWEQQLSFLRRLYGDDQGVSRIIRYLQFKMDCAASQEATRWKLDVKKCKEGVSFLEKEKQEKTEELKSIMPEVPRYVTKRRPKKLYKQNGSLSALGERWFELLREQGLPEDTVECSYVVGYDEPNPASVPQLKDFLFSLGWKPDEFKFNRNKETGEVKKVPQINKQAPDEVGVTESVKLLYEKEPKLEVLDGLSVLNHRRSILQGFLDNMDEEGYIKAQIQGFTNTLRFKHKVVLNLPKVDKPYGELVRGVLIAPEGYELCGSDMSSLEDRGKQHFMQPYDPEYVEEMSSDDYDPHLDLANYAGEVTNEQYRAYVEGDHEVKKMVSGIRSVYKATNYAL